MFADHDGGGDDGGDEDGEDQHHDDDDHPQVLQVKAVDGDRGIRNPITYSITGGPDHLFAINKLNGLVYVNVTLNLFFPSYHLITEGHTHIFAINKLSGLVPCGKFSFKMASLT